MACWGGGFAGGEGGLVLLLELFISRSMFVMLSSLLEVSFLISEMSVSCRSSS